MHPHSIEVALTGGPVPPGFITIKWGGTGADLNSQGDYIYILYIYIYIFDSFHVFGKQILAAHFFPEQKVFELPSSAEQ